MKRTSYAAALSAVLALVLSGCGGGGGGADTKAVRSVTISWQANRETAVNQTGGGYIVNVSGQAPIAVPYVAGASAPTSTTLSLPTGTYSATVTAYSALNPPGGRGGSQSLPSTTVTINVP